jgi:hypothetical protein
MKLTVMMYLYVKKHNKTGLKYLGQTKRSNPFNYKGSGKYWTRHIENHGNDVTTLILLETENIEELERVSRFFSDFFDVVNSKKWANLIPETGIDINGINETGKNLYGMNGKTPNVSDNFERGRETKKLLWKNDPEWAEKTRQNISKSLKSHYETNGSHWSGRHHSDETKSKIGQKSAIYQDGVKNSQYGTTWITNGIISYKISNSEDIPDNYKKGHCNNPPFLLSNLGLCSVCYKLQKYVKNYETARYWYDLYINMKAKSLQDFINKSDYQYSRVSLYNMFNKYIEEYRK